MSRVGDQLKRNSSAIGTVNSRVNTVSSAEKKDNEDRRKDFKDINQKIQLLALLPLLVRPSTATLGTAAIPSPVTDAAGNPVNQVLTPEASTLNTILPLLLISGLGGSGGLGLGGDSGSDSGLLLMALVLAFAK